MDFLKQTLNILLDLFTVLLFLRVIFSWMVRDRSVLSSYLFQVTEPVLAPVRRLLPRIGMLDLSPLVVLVLMDVLRQLINASL